MRRLTRTLGTIALLVLGAWLALYAREWLFRIRAERLLVDIKLLVPNQSTWRDAQKLITRWGAWGGWYGSCDAEDCAYEIILSDALPGSSQFVYEETPHLGARIADFFHLRSADVRATVHVHGGLVVDKAFTLQVDLPFRYWLREKTYWPSLDTGFSEGSRLRGTGRIAWRTPNRNLYQSRVTLIARFTPEEAPEEQRSLMDIRFTCVTRLIPCQDRSLLSLKAEQEFREEQAMPGPNPEPPCFPTVQVRAREAHDIFVGRMIPGVAAEKQQVSVVEILKGFPKNKPGDLIPMYRAASARPLTANTIFIESPGHRFDYLHDAALTVDDCGQVEATEENMDAVRRGVKDAFAPSVF